MFSHLKKKKIELKNLLFQIPNVRHKVSSVPAHLQTLFNFEPELRFRRKGKYLFQLMWKGFGISVRDVRLRRFCQNNV